MAFYICKVPYVKSVRSRSVTEAVDDDFVVSHIHRIGHHGVFYGRPGRQTVFKSAKGFQGKI